MTRASTAMTAIEEARMAVGNRRTNPVSKYSRTTGSPSTKETSAKIPKR